MKHCKVPTDNQMKINAWEIMQRYASKPVRDEIATFAETVALKLRKINNEGRRLELESKILRQLNDAISMNHQQPVTIITFNPIGAAAQNTILTQPSTPTTDLLWIYRMYNIK